MTREDLTSLLGEGFHTAFRKAIDHPSASLIHRLISDLPSEEWSAVLEFVVDGLPEELLTPEAEVQALFEALAPEATETTGATT